MTNIKSTRRGKIKQKKSQFQKLWDKTDRLQRKNEQLRDSMDGLIETTEKLVRPVEAEAVKAELPLLHKLLTLGQRKSLAKWERQVLDEWIKDLVSSMQIIGIADDDLLNCVARYDAFRLGIELDEDSEGESGTPYEQVTDHVKNLQREMEDTAEQERAEAETDFKNRKKKMEDMVESILDQNLGPPPITEGMPSGTTDMFQNELDAESKKRAANYHAKREALREEIMNDINDGLQFEFDAFSFEDEFFFDSFSGPDFSFEGEYQHTPADITAPKIDNQTFRKMFRATAAKLHPDREPDTEKRLKKQRLMAELLTARKKGDVLTVFKMYQLHTDNSESFSKADEKQLIEALNHHIEQLHEEYEEIICQSPAHLATYEQFYHTSKKKQNIKIEKHIKEVRRSITETEKMTNSIRSLKTLKPWLEDRYDQMMFATFDDFIYHSDLRDIPF